jgi:hypothetical protein
MSWNIRPLRRTQTAPTCSADISSTSPAEISPSARRQLLAILRRLAAVLQLTAEAAERAGKLEHHALLDARLAIFRARVEAGETGALLARALAEFGEEFNAFITLDLGFRRA